MGTYSLLNVVATLSGPGGVISIGSDAGIAEEGIGTVMAGDKNSMTIGGGGDGMHSLHASKAGQITVTLLKTSPVNALLSNLYAFQTSGGGVFHGQNTITVRDFARGDVVSAHECAFKKFPDNYYGAEAGMMTWTFDCVKIDEKLGSGTPAI